MNFADYLDFAKHRLGELMASHEYEKANCFLMDTAPLFLTRDEDVNRQAIFHTLFFEIGKNYRTQYQCYDFECVDYDLYRFSDDMPMVRGPRPSAADFVTGNYITIMGAAQLFGRFHAVPLHRMIALRCKVPVLNLSVGGAGPGYFLSRKRIIQAANRSRFVILQVLSGRSIGCEEYPGERLTAPANRPGTPARDRLEILEEIWHESRAEAKRLVSKWSGNYVRAYLDLIKRIERPVVLVWMSERAPEEWTPDHLDKGPRWGAFPQLVSREMVSEIANECAHYLEACKDPGLPYTVTSRVTGRSCPYFEPDGELRWENNYYSSIEMHKEIFQKMTAVLELPLFCAIKMQVRCWQPPSHELVEQSANKVDFHGKDYPGDRFGPFACGRKGLARFSLRLAWRPLPSSEVLRSICGKYGADERYELL